MEIIPACRESPENPKLPADFWNAFPTSAMRRFGTIEQTVMGIGAPRKGDRRTNWLRSRT
jgi:hypothetical protein